MCLEQFAWQRKVETHTDSVLRMSGIGLIYSRSENGTDIGRIRVGNSLYAFEKGWARQINIIIWDDVYMVQVSLHQCGNSTNRISWF